MGVGGKDPLGSGLSPAAQGGAIYHVEGAGDEGLQLRGDLTVFEVNRQRLLGAQVRKAGERPGLGQSGGGRGMNKIGQDKGLARRAKA